MSLTQKLFALQSQIDELVARVDKLERDKQQLNDLLLNGRADPWPGARPMEVDEVRPQDLGKYIWSLPSDDQLTKPIDTAKPIASATMAPPPKKRGRPPKA